MPAISDTLPPRDGLASSSKRVLLLLACAGLCLNLLLLWWKWSDPSASIAGCGGGSGCANVLASRWSQVAGIPVSLPGAMMYLGIFATVIWRKWSALLVCLMTLGVGALWFMVVQAAVLHQFCPWCNTAHLVGLAAVAVGLHGLRGSEGFRAGCVTATMCAVGLVAVLAMIQVITPAPATHRMGEATSAGSNDASTIHALGGGRLVKFARGRKSFAVEALPHLGAADAPHVLVEYFDYQCAACRTMHGHLKALLAAHPDKLCVIVLPVPLEAACNKRMVPGDQVHPGSCHLARLALAVWRSSPRDFPAIHDAFFEDPAPSDPMAERLAKKSIAQDKWQQAVEDPWISAVFTANANDWYGYSKEGKQMPKLLVKDNRMVHGLPSSREDFLRVMKSELGL